MNNKEGNKMDNDDSFNFALKGIAKQFNQALGGSGGSRNENGNGSGRTVAATVPAIGTTEEIRVRCPYCDKNGKRYVGTHGDHYQYGPQLYGTCPTCGGTKISERHRFPKAIVTLANLLAYKEPLAIAQILAKIAEGYEPQ